MDDIQKKQQLMDMLNFSFNPEQPQQFNMTAPENLMMPEETPVPPPKRSVASTPNVAPVPTEAPKLNPAIVQHLKDKYGLLDPEAYDAQMVKAQEDAKERKSGLGLAQFAAGMGQSLAGRDPLEAAKTFQGYRDNIDKETVGNLENRRKAQMDNLSGNSMLQKMQSDSDAKDPNSQQSLAFRKIIESKFPDVARSYGKDWATVTAADQDLIFKPLQLKEQIEARKEQARILSMDKSERQQERAEEKKRERMTPFGLANTNDDAKKLKEAGEMKTKLDSQINELIALRKAKGAEVMNRDVVARAKQLSNDLLLTKKNLENLGVLSQSDRDIVNEIIPTDPTEFKFAQLAGQDPILTKLENFKKDTDNDFQGRLKTRLQNPGSAPAPSSQAPSVSEVERLDPKTGKIAIFDSATKKFLRYK